MEIKNNIRDTIRNIVIEWTHDHYKARAQMVEEEILTTINDRKLNPLVKINNIQVILLSSSLLSKCLEYNACGFFNTTTQNEIVNDKIITNDDLLDILFVLESRIFSSLESNSKHYQTKIADLLSQLYPDYAEKTKPSGAMTMLYIISINKDIILNNLKIIAKEILVDIEKLTKKV